MQAHLGDVIGVYGDNVYEAVVGTQSNQEVTLKKAREEVHKVIKDELYYVGLSRLRTNWFRLQTGRTREI